MKSFINEAVETKILDIFQYILKVYKSKYCSIKGFKKYCLDKFRHSENLDSQELVKKLDCNFLSKNFSASNFKDLDIFWWFNIPITLVPSKVAKLSFQDKLGGLYYQNGILLVAENNFLEEVLIHELIHCFLDYLFSEEEDFNYFNSHPLIQIYLSLRHETITYSLANWWSIKSFNDEELFLYLTTYKKSEIDNLLSTQSKIFLTQYIKHFKKQILSNNSENRESLITNCLRSPDMCQWIEQET